MNNNSFKHYSHSFTKIYPHDFSELTPQANPIFTATDWRTRNYIRQSKGICLLFDKPANYYDLSFCYQKEIWALYSSQAYFTNALQVGRAAQLSGASKVLVLFINADSRGTNYASN